LSRLACIISISAGRTCLPRKACRLKQIAGRLQGYACTGEIAISFLSFAILPEKWQRWRAFAMVELWTRRLLGFVSIDWSRAVYYALEEVVVLPDVSE